MTVAMLISPFHRKTSCQYTFPCSQIIVTGARCTRDVLGHVETWIPGLLHNKWNVLFQRNGPQFGLLTVVATTP